MKYLRQTPTNSADDSKGHSLGLEGDQFMFIIAGLVAGVILLLVCMKSGMSPGLSLTVGVLPLPLCIIWLIVFKIGKPPRYTSDLFQKWQGNTSLTQEKYKPNPFYEILSHNKDNNEV